MIGKVRHLWWSHDSLNQSLLERYVTSFIVSDVWVPIMIIIYLDFDLSKCHFKMKMKMKITMEGMVTPYKTELYDANELWYHS